MTTATTEGGRTAAHSRGRRFAARFGLRNWRVRTRLTALILVPTVVGVVLAGTRVVASIDSVAGYQRTASAAEYSGSLRELAQALGLERDRVAWAAFQPSNQGLQEVATAQEKTVDALVSQVRLDLQSIDDSYGQRAAEAAKDVGYQLAGLGELRKLPGTNRAERYSIMIAPLLQLHEELTLVSDDPEIIGNTRALSALARAKEEVSRQRSRLLAGYYAPSQITAQEIEKFIASRSRMEEYKADFTIEASGANRQLLVKALMDEKVYRAELTKARAIVLASGSQPQGRLLTDFAAVKQWFSDNTTILDRMKKVETQVAAAVITRARELEDTEQRNAIIASGLILLLLMLVLGLTVLIARSMVLPLRRLRSEALDVAGFKLPEVVRNLRVSGETRAPDVAPISVDTKDEIGEVAKAFDEVHQQAVRLAAEESELRSNISAMFVNLSRRTQTLVERQISLIDGLEKGEEDGGRLSDLFKLDHLATRMRRNSENLLVLAGHEPSRRRSQPAKLVDVVRASLSEVEDYERVQVKVHRTLSVAGSAANDVVHLIAELVENAIQFSPRASQVVVSSSMIEGGGALLAVSDAGIGMTNEELIETNRRLADPPVVDVSVSRRMGLFVVGRLALRHGIRVQLRPQETGGLIAMVLFPAALIVETTQPSQTPSWGGDSQSQSSFGQSSFGQSSFAGTSLSRTSQNSFPQNSFAQGHPSFPQQDPFASASFADEHPFPADQPIASGSLGAPAGTAYPLPKRPVPGAGGGAGAPPSTASGFSAWGHSSHDALEAHDDPATASMPAVRVSPLEPEQEEFLPIFASVESAWFRRTEAAANGYVSPEEPEEPEETYEPEESGGPVRPAAQDISEPETRDDAPEAQTGDPGQDSEPVARPLRPRTPVREPENWETAADAGWRAAQAASDPTLGGITAAGLPKRTPKANLVPGTAGVPAAPSTPMPPLSPERVRSRLSSFQQGVRRGRAELNEDAARTLADREESS
ncbi:sensor histidine kinase [Streptosporangium saharense]|uniref:histidine kinase n=1 Tax=Streptosporangium saharense TaxID=1706840 RepID=A0A7W7QJE2_9ACTN|nr:nitrate- and nitrite sensing domain-containing protein [Streptosporangium saharense]MBB4914649.1 signal transduction histidine kinase [Streptosporangium saharense]